MPFYAKRDIYSPSGGVAVDVSVSDWTSPAGAINDRTPTPTSALYLGVTGSIIVGFADNPNTQVPLYNLPAGVQEVSVTKIYATGTTASQIVALY